MKQCSTNVVNAAELVKKNPHDANSQQSLNNAQKSLGVAVQKVVELTGENDAEVSNAMSDIKDSQREGAESNALQAAQQVNSIFFINYYFLILN